MACTLVFGNITEFPALNLNDTNVKFAPGILNFSEIWHKQSEVTQAKAHSGEVESPAQVAIPLKEPIAVKVPKSESEIFSKLEEVLATRFAARAEKVVKRKANGMWTYRKPTWKDKRAQRQAARVAAEEQAFMIAPPYEVTTISIGGGLKPSQIERSRKPQWHGVNRTSPKKVRGARTKPPVMLNATQFEQLCRRLRRILEDKQAQIEIIDKGVTRGKYVKKYKQTYLQVHLKHMEGHIVRTDLIISKDNQSWINFFAHTLNWKNEICTWDVQPGWSGFVLHQPTLLGPHSITWDGLLIVRGDSNGKLIDARRPIPLEMRAQMVHYNDIPTLYWRGFSRVFQLNKPELTDHTCESVFSVEKCGEVAALLSQVTNPSRRITCPKCAEIGAQRTKSEFKEIFESKAQHVMSELSVKYPEFVHARHFVELYQTMITATNTNYEAFAEIKQLIGDREDAPFSHVIKVNDLLIKGGELSSSELSAASDHLREVARYLKNRTENIRLGSLKSFRNKISSKAHVNTSLMCDNQLDLNGNFLWGQRGLHAKRFFNNFFDEIDPADGYQSFVLRRNPNGSRKLAIGNLIISTRLERIREQIQGEPVEEQKLTQECTSKLRGMFVYPCSCVTHEDGSPLLSEAIMPTKHHLVLGNTGDPKYLDLPARDDMKMYIAKEGYCYINIFMAMLVNVSEPVAKGFTKQARDEMIPKLGKWPTLQDLATACHYLTVFYPETTNAELPRILVDHQTRTMHVIDSYGSLSTGFHVLKANTIAQLVKFANNQMESEMKLYKVGGKNTDLDNEIDNAPHIEYNENTKLKQLLKGVYRPQVMADLLKHEPYLLVLSMLSPGVLMALYNSGSLEWAVHNMLHVNNSLAFTLKTLHVLAEKVAVSTTLHAQIQTLQSHAGAVLETLDPAAEGDQSLHLARLVLERLCERDNTDHALIFHGFASKQAAWAEIMEKSYLAQLEASWRELSWRGKLSAIRFSHKWRPRTTKVLIPKRSADLGGRYDISLGSLPVKSLNRVQQAYSAGCKRFNAAKHRFSMWSVGKALTAINKMVPDIVKLVNLCILFQVLLGMIFTLRCMLDNYREVKSKVALNEAIEMNHRVDLIYRLLHAELSRPPTKKEFRTRVEEISPHLLGSALQYYHGTDEEDTDVETYKDVITLQSKGRGQNKLEQIIAMAALVMMMFDSERSDAVYRSLQKLKFLTTTADDCMTFQSLDDISDVLTEKKQTIDFTLEGAESNTSQVGNTTFGQWWENQLMSGNTLPHYRSEGHFMRFTRETAADVAHRIASEDYMDILLSGAVGSGKSTGLPSLLSKRGGVLMIESTRPLAENVCKQLRCEPFYLSPTLRMRGLSVFGSSPITVMTSGYALHYLANNTAELKQFKFIIFDECHVIDANAMAFRCLLHECNVDAKIIKVSATPPGREEEFQTQYPVDIVIEESLSLKQFADSQGTGARCDMLSKGDNILVYLASYSDIDTLASMLHDKDHKVTKVDGRTMKSGSTEIKTCGTPTKKHFVLATNIIENGVTLDIDVVVDFGLKIVADLDVDNRRFNYMRAGISYGERIQRLGRVGRFKKGTALRIGVTNKGVAAIPQAIATEAAFHCFTYGLPVMAHNVSTSLLSKCTIRQARTMQLFELSPFFTATLVRYDGSMHASIHDILKKYKLRESKVILNKLAIPSNVVSHWLTTDEYGRIGNNIIVPANTRIPFYLKDIPDQVYQNIWESVVKYKGDAGFGTVSCANVCKIAYTLRTDSLAIPRTIAIIDALMAEERQKAAHFADITSNSCSITGFSIASIVSAYKSKRMENHTVENISKLQAAKDSILNFENTELEYESDNETYNGKELNRKIYNTGALDAIRFQSKEEVSAYFGLKGRWNKPLIARDIIVTLGVFLGGSWMIYEWFKEQWSDTITLQGKMSKRQKQKLKFRQARDHKTHFEVDADDDSLRHYYGEAYTKKGKKSGKTHGMGKKNKPFVNMYGFDPTEYSFIRYVDPVTGATKDEGPLTDLSLVQDYFGDLRKQLLDEGELEKQSLTRGIEAYVVKNLNTQALKIDLTPHKPLLVSNVSNNVMGFPEREFELRQTGQPLIVHPSIVPDKNENHDEIQFEAKTKMGGLRDYNPIASVVCQLTNETDGQFSTMYGIGYGSMVITNSHLLKRGNGVLTVKSRHGEFVCRDVDALRIVQCEMRDVILIRMPRDFPPFPSKIKFRTPESNERICMVGSLFQDKCITSMVSDTSPIVPCPDNHFWKHWISTKNGNCGLPMVSTRDGTIVGIHCGSSDYHDHNFMTSLPDDFTENHLKNPESLNWQRQWKFNTNNIVWGSLELSDGTPKDQFKISKIITDLFSDSMKFQGLEESWFMAQLSGNLKAVARSSSQLVTKHVVKGKCMLFSLYLSTHPEENAYFQQYMGAYGKSRLNREAFSKDLLKYSKPITVGQVDADAFEMATETMFEMLQDLGFQECEYVTDEEAIFEALNMKAAVGALYSGKKKDYFANYTTEDKANILKASCERLFLGQMGVWNGSLKAELRPMEKVEANKTRTFTAAPVDTLLGGKVCVDDFNNQFYSLNLKAPWTVGMTKFYGGWNTLLESLPNEWVYCDADGSQFDSSLSPYLINAVLRLRLEFMEEWDIGERMLRNLYTEIVYTPILTPDSTIVKKSKGNNSGQPSTVVDNTLMVILAIVYSLIKLGHPYRTHKDIIKYFVNGDDLLIAVRPDMEGVLDEFQSLFASLGLNYDFSSRTRNKEELWFMSHKGLKLDGMYIPKLEEERIVSILEWDRSAEPIHRLEALCAAMIESWGYERLTFEIRKFYQWVLEQSPYSELAKEGKAPYIAETALRKLYTSQDPTPSELAKYFEEFDLTRYMHDEFDSITFQANETDETKDAGASAQSVSKKKDKGPMDNPPTTEKDVQPPLTSAPRNDGVGSSDPHTTQDVNPVADRDVNVGTTGTFQLPVVKAITGKIRLPRMKKQVALNLDHLLTYMPDSVDISNTRATMRQFDEWCDGIMNDYDIKPEELKLVLNGLMVWCIENGTSPNINGMWTMMKGDEQLEYPIKPLIDHAKPTFRQIMAHFSDAAEAYIVMVNTKRPYMPRYGLQRGLNDRNLARYAFDFYEVNSRTPNRAREAHHQMKAAALRGSSNRMFGLDGKANTEGENTERHTTDDVKQDMHSLLGVIN
nr:polyprotein [Pecan mosaic-associated virus]